MVDLYMAYFAMEEGRDSAEATLLDLSKGNCTLPSKLVDLEVSLNAEKSIMAPLYYAYWGAKGVTEPTLALTVENAKPEEKERLINALKVVDELNPDESEKSTEDTAATT